MNEKNVGALARFMGISLHTIKYYDKIGILSSDRDEKSNYRKYDLRICTDLSECVKYRSMGFSLKELEVLRKTADSGQQQAMLDERLSKVEEEVNRMVCLRDRMREYRDECRRVEEELGEWYIEPFDQVVYCRMQTKNMTFTDENLAMDSVNIMDFAPGTKSVAILSRSFLEGGEPEFSWGQSVSVPRDEDSRGGGMRALFENQSGYTRFAPKKAFVTYRRYTGFFVSNGEMAEDLRNSFHEYAPAFPGDAYAFGIKIVHDEEGRDWNYFKIVVPLK